MRYIWIFLLLPSCIFVESPIINEIEPNNKNWSEIYLEEMRIARENDDIQAWIFFLREYEREIAK